MHHQYAILAVDVARQRSLEAEAFRRAREAMAARAGHPGRLRRRLASGLAAIARGSAVAARRLDDCTTDDLREAFGAR